MMLSAVGTSSSVRGPRVGVWAPSTKSRVVACQAESSETVQVAAGAAGVVAAPLCLYSEYVLKTTGAGLPPGPGGLVGAAEGISYLVVVGLVSWSAYTKVQTGSGLPAGPSGLLGAAEGFSYLALLGGLTVIGLNAIGV
eukprot:jgi/Ulvmu1/6465/UM003_0096.1